MLESDREHVEADRQGVRWALPVLLVAAAVITGGMIYAMSGVPTTTTASNDAPISTSSPARTPAREPIAPAPGPVTPVPAPSR